MENDLAEITLLSVILQKKTSKSMKMHAHHVFRGQECLGQRIKPRTCLSLRFVPLLRTPVNIASHVAPFQPLTFTSLVLINDSFHSNAFEVKSVPASGC